MDSYTYIITGIALLGVGIWLWRRVFQRVTVNEYETALMVRNGQIVCSPGVGRHRVMQIRERLLVMDTRPRIARLTGQEVLTADLIPVRLGLVVRLRLVDAKKAFLAQSQDGVQFMPFSEQDPVSGTFSAAYDSVHSAIRKVVSTLTIDEILSQRETLADRVLAESSPEISALGLEVVQVQLRDFVLPGEFKKAFSQVVVAKQEGLAALERARGEIAALRSLANAARMLTDNPNLAVLRAIQAMENGKGTLVLGSDPSASVQRKAPDPS